MEPRFQPVNVIQRRISEECVAVRSVTDVASLYATETSTRGSKAQEDYDVPEGRSDDHGDTKCFGHQETLDSRSTLKSVSTVMSSVGEMFSCTITEHAL